jgi:hypothetical protein
MPRVNNGGDNVDEREMREDVGRVVYRIVPFSDVS